MYNTHTGPSVGVRYNTHIEKYEFWGPKRKERGHAKIG